MIQKIISGAQTGADKAGLDVAIKLGIPHGGWVPKGRKCEKGKVHLRYEVKETASSGYRGRTRKNVMSADGTIIICKGKLSGGSALTKRFAVEHDKPWLFINLNRDRSEKSVKMICSWLEENKIKILNVAGSRESKHPGIYKSTLKLLEQVIAKNSDTAGHVSGKKEEKVSIGLCG